MQEEPKLNYKRLIALVVIGAIGALGLYKLSCSKSEEKPEEPVPYSTLVDKVTQDLPNNPEYIDILIQRSIDTANKQNLPLQEETHMRMFRRLKNLMVKRPELSDHLPKNVIDYQLKKHKFDIKKYLPGGN